MDGTAGSRTVWLAPPGPIRSQNGLTESFFVTRDNAAESVERILDVNSKSGWQSEVAIGQLRVDGLVSVDAAYVSESDAATLLTKPLLGFNGTLHLNVDAGAGGSVIVEVLNATNGERLATSTPVIGNSISARVEWGGLGAVESFANTAGAVQLLLRLQACSLYSLSFGQQ